MATKTKQLKPLKLKPEHADRVEAHLIDVFRREIYLPLMREVGAGKRLIANAVDDLISAIRSGRIHYVGSRFEGTFNAAVSRELKRAGAAWDKGHRAWAIPFGQLPTDVQTAVAEAKAKFDAMAEKIFKRLDGVAADDVAGQINLDDIYDSTIYHIDHEFERQVAALEIETKFSDEQRKRISAEYTNNMKLYVKDFVREEVKSLRKQVARNAFQAPRRESLVRTIQDSYGTTLNKSKFLARQETNLLLVKVQQTRYQEVGVDEYRWRCVAGSPAHPVRPLHKALDGKIFRWDDPPIVDELGNRKHPKQDYNCRCEAHPIVKF